MIYLSLLTVPAYHPMKGSRSVLVPEPSTHLFSGFLGALVGHEFCV